MQPENAPAVENVRARIAFEHMVMSVLLASIIGAGAYFLTLNAGLMADGRWGLQTLAGAVYNMFRYSFLSFLGGFLIAVVIGLPLFAGLERMKARIVWPFFAAGVAANVIALALAGAAAPAEALVSPERAALFLPGVIAPAFFTRRIKPLWNAAPATPQPFDHQLH